MALFESSHWKSDETSVDKLTVQVIESLLHIVYSITVQGAKSKLRKTDCVKALERAMNENSGKFESFVDSLSVNVQLTS